MNQDFENCLITITDEDGKECEMEIISTVEYNGKLYYALVEADKDDDSDDMEVTILRAEEEHGEEILVVIDNDDEADEVYHVLIDQLWDNHE